MTSADACAGCPGCDALVRQLEELKAENARLRDALHQRGVVVDNESVRALPEAATVATPSGAAADEVYSPLSRPEMQRYSRQMLVPDFRVERQLRLRRARVLIIGAGGLGCPAALYLGGMGVGCIGLVDDDRVERSNLHRQIGHDESTVGKLKVESLARRVRSLNSDVQIETHATRFTTKNASDLVQAYDLVLDASDNPTTRYLVNDICARHTKPLVSGSALGLEGQVTIFTYAPDTACYRCLYPTPPQAPQSCEENGVLGVVPGIIGCLQALEAVKVLTDFGATLSGTQVLFDAYDTQFRRLKYTQRRRTDCSSCGTNATAGPNGLDALTSCVQESDEVLRPEHRMDVFNLHRLRRGIDGARYVLLDTRASHQFEMVHFPEAVNVPFEQLRRAHLQGELTQFVHEKARADPDGEEHHTLVICRRGVDSAVVTAWLVACGWKNVFNVDGGYTQYADELQGVDKQFPMY